MRIGHLVKICLFAFLIIGLFSPDIVKAANTSYSLSNELNVEIAPNNPEPGQNVSINLTLYTGDLNSANITWLQDGKTVLKGIGEKSYSFKIGQAGTKTTIQIQISLTNGEFISKTFSLVPTSVDLVWEANSYVPPFYKGKALHSRQGELKIVAIPEFVVNGKKVPPENLIYKWSNNVDQYQNDSGYGKNVLILNGSLLGKSENIKLTVTDPKSNYSAKNSIQINPSDPEIVLYENDPYYGFIFDSALNQYNLKKQEVQVFVAPFYFTRSNTIQYVWRLNNQKLSDIEGSRLAIFRRPETDGGQSLISVVVDNPDKVLQQAEAKLTINFEK